MSIFNTATARCPFCGNEVEIAWAASVNADRRPDLRVAVLDGSFQAEACPGCGTVVRLAPHLTYVDLRRGDWVLVEATTERARWAEHETEARRLFESTFGPGGPSGLRDLAGGAKPRLVFGWVALREKIICKELGLDDVTLELLKMAVIRNIPGAPLGGDRALRLVRGDDSTLYLRVVDDATEDADQELEVPRALHDDIAGDPKPWAALREELTGVPLVDLQRLTLAG